MFLLQLILFLIICAFVLFIIILLSSYFYYSSDITNKIKFESFKSFYNINPDRWELKDGYVTFLKPSDRYTYILHHDIIKFKFGFIDYCLYAVWKRNVKRNKQTLQSCKEYQEVLDIIKADIERFNKNNAAETKEKLEELWR